MNLISCLSSISSHHDHLLCCCYFQPRPPSLLLLYVILLLQYYFCSDFNNISQTNENPFDLMLGPAWRFIKSWAAAVVVSEALLARRVNLLSALGEISPGIVPLRLISSFRRLRFLFGVRDGVTTAATAPFWTTNGSGGMS